MSFHEVQFPKSISWASKSGVGYNTSVIETDGGQEHRVARWDSGKHMYDISYAIKSYSDLSIVKSFFMARKGALNGFRFSDPADYTSNTTNPAFDGGGSGVADQSIGTGDGSTTVFQLIKTYTSGLSSEVRVIEKPVAGTVRIYFNGVLQASGWSVDTTTGIVTFTSPPTAGVAIAASFEFDVPVRFGSDVDKTLSTALTNYGQGDIDSISLVELVNPQPGYVTDYFYGGSYEVVINANTTLSTGLGKLWVIGTQASGLKAVLPDPTDIPTGGIIFTVINEGPDSIDLTNHLGSVLLSIAVGKGVDVILSKAADDSKVWIAI